MAEARWQRSNGGLTHARQAAAYATRRAVSGVA
jgi:hypothetical protein